VVWYERSSQLCPECKYDVAQTLSDGFYVCPECGAPVTEDLCRREVHLIPRGHRALIYAAWSLPLVGALPSLLAPRLWWLSVAGALAVYASWVWIHQWLNEPCAWRRAIAPALAVLLLEMLLAGIVVAVLGL
jgi:hypothetical protein